MLKNRSHKCKVVDILTETQYIEMYDSMKNKLTHIVNISRNKDDIEFRNRRKEINNKRYQKRKSKQQTEHNDN